MQHTNRCLSAQGPNDTTDLHAVMQNSRTRLVIRLQTYAKISSCDIWGHSEVLSMENSAEAHKLAMNLKSVLFAQPNNVRSGDPKNIWDTMRYMQLAEWTWEERQLLESYAFSQLTRKTFKYQNVMIWIQR